MKRGISFFDHFDFDTSIDRLHTPSSITCLHCTTPPHQAHVLGVSVDISKMMLAHCPLTCPIDIFLRIASSTNSSARCRWPKLMPQHSHVVHGVTCWRLPPQQAPRCETLQIGPFSLWQSMQVQLPRAWLQRRLELNRPGSGLGIASPAPPSGQRSLYKPHD